MPLPLKPPAPWGDVVAVASPRLRVCRTPQNALLEALTCPADTVLLVVHRATVNQEHSPIAQW